MSAPKEGVFAAHFRAKVVPALQERCAVQGFFLALDRVDFEDAHRDIMRAAVDRGALHLPAPVLRDLDAWIAIQLMDVALSHEPAIADARLTAERVGNELDAYFAAFDGLTPTDEGSSLCEAP